MTLETRQSSVTLCEHTHLAMDKHHAIRDNQFVPLPRRSFIGLMVSALAVCDRAIQSTQWTP